MDHEVTGAAECLIEDLLVGRYFVIHPLGGGSANQMDFDGNAVLSTALEAGRAEHRRSLPDARRRADDILRSSPWCGRREAENASSSGAVCAL